MPFIDKYFLIDNHVLQLDYLDLFNHLILQVLMEEVVRQNITDRQWIASEAWVTYSTLSSPKNLPSLAGTIGFALKKAVIPSLGPFLTRLRPDGDYQKSDPFLRELWEEIFGCSLGIDLSTTPSSRRQCTGSEIIGEGEFTTNALFLCPDPFPMFSQ